jgi:hypothetical protein
VKPNASCLFLLGVLPIALTAKKRTPIPETVHELGFVLGIRKKPKGIIVIAYVVSSARFMFGETKKQVKVRSPRNTKMLNIRIVMTEICKWSDAKRLITLKNKGGYKPEVFILSVSKNNSGVIAKFPDWQEALASGLYAKHIDCARATGIFFVSEVNPGSHKPGRSPTPHQILAR